MQQTKSSLPSTRPWWRYGHVWLVISGPAIVVVAGLATVWIAFHSQDPVVDENYYQAGININKTLTERQRALTPAMQGRNHSMTPAEDLPAAQR